MRECPVMVPVTGGRIGQEVVSSALSRRHQIVSGGRPLSGTRRMSSVTSTSCAETIVENWCVRELTTAAPLNPGT